MDNKKIQTRNGVSKQDSKKDNTSNPRQWPKNARRRESTNSKSSQDQQLRNGSNNNGSNANSQQYRNNSERRARFNRTNNSHAAAPRPAESDGGGAGLAVDAEDDDEDELYLEAAEWDSVLVPGSKKHNLNHLLNFHYAPRDRDITTRPGGKRRDNHKNAAKSTVAQYNKDQFLQANCNFIVKQLGDYKAHLNNPDTLVDWQMIEEVVIRSAEEPQCPICLFPPVAAKMTKCGHVYCWPCILHYLALSDKEWRKCPICYDAVHIRDLKSTVSWPYHEYSMNETVDFQLMCRRKGSLDVIKVGDQEQHNNEGRGAKFPHLFAVRDQQIVHSKLILANPMEVASVVDRERCELEEQMKTDGPEGFNCPEMMFIQQALDLLGEREKANAIGGNEVAALDEDEGLALYDGLPEDAEEYHYFYQAVDGQHLYMHSINNRMLQAQFGGLANCPPIVTGRIVHREHFSVSDALRKRIKYLQHLPLTSIITIVEVTFMADLFSPEVKEQFAEEINQRKRDRQRRARDEKKREKHINELNDRQMGKLMAQNAGFVREEVDYCPFFINESENGTRMEQHQGSFEGEPSPLSGSAGSPNRPFSFAKMLQCASEIEKTQPELWPTLANKKGGAWGVANAEEQQMDAAGPSARDNNNPRASKMDKHFPNLLDTIEIDEDEMPPIATKASEDGPLPPLPSKSGPKGTNCGGASKRAPKKKKQQLLFSTDMNFNRN